MWPFGRRLSRASKLATRRIGIHLTCHREAARQSRAELRGLEPLTPRLQSALQEATTRCALRRPLADRVKGSRYHNMKDLRPPSPGSTEIRMLFAFDPRREAIFLVAGDKPVTGTPGTARQSRSRTNVLPGTWPS